MKNDSKPALKDAKNVIVIGKTGLGKSFFLNLLLNESKPQNGTFKVYHKLESGTMTCQVEVEKKVKYSSQPNDELTLNLIDTPGLFDTQDDPKVQYNNEKSPASIQHLKQIDTFIVNEPFQSQFNRVILVLGSDQKFDVQHKGMIDISKIMIGQQLKVCVAITKCQNLYDNELDEEFEKIEKLKHFQNEWKTKLANFEIEDVFFFGNSPISRYTGNDEISKFYYGQWIQLYENLKKSIKTPINMWENLPVEKKQIIGNYFNYTIGKTPDMIQKELSDSLKQLNDKYEAKIKETQREQQLLQQQQQLQLQKIQQNSDQKLKELEQRFAKQQSEMQATNSQQLEELKRHHNIEIQKVQENSKKQAEDNKRQADLQEAKLTEKIKNLEKEKIQIKKEDPVKKVQKKYHNDGDECVSLDVHLKSQNNLIIEKHNSTKIKLKGLLQDNTYLGLIHYSEDQECCFRRFTYTYFEGKGFVELTNEHLIFVSNQNQFIQASKVTVNDTLLYTDQNDCLQNVQISEIKEIIKRGYYSPLTSTGQFFGNGILMSCYISPNEFPVSQQIAHYAMKPLILYRQIVMKWSDEGKTQEKKHKLKNYQAPYSKILQKIFYK